jgi:hypothetical protein
VKKKWPFGAGHGFSAREALVFNRDGMPARLGAHWEADFTRLCASSPISSCYTAMPILLVEWQGTQERWNPEVAIIFGAAARYYRATDGISHFTRGWFAPAQAFGEPPLHTASYGLWQFAGVRYTARFFVNFVGVRFSCGYGASIFFSGPIEAEERHSLAVSSGWLFLSAMAQLLLGEEDSTSQPRWLSTAARIVVKEVGKSLTYTRRSCPSLNDSFFVLPVTLLLVLASSTSGEL